MTRRQQRRRAQRRVHEVKLARARRRRIAAGAGLSVGAALGMTATAQAVDITVNDTTDTQGGGSLRNAITQAELTPAADRILFQSGLTGTIALTGPLPTITKPLEIQGPGAGTLTVDGNGSRIFDIPVVAGYTDVTLSGLTLTDGNGNLAPFGGGAIASSGDLIVEDCVISGNTAVRGGGLWVSGGTAIVRDTTMSTNHALDTTGGYGGGAIANYASLTVEGSTISGNDTQADGGGIHTRGQTTIQDSTISFNSAPQAGSAGGGLSAYTAGVVTIEGSTVSGNTTTSTSDGAGLYLRDVFATIDRSTISGNTGAFNGGGVWAESGTLAFQDATIAGNSAVNGGGGINSRGHATDPSLVSTIVADNTAPSGPNIQDGGVGPTSDAFRLDFSLIEDASGAGTTNIGPASSIVGTGGSPVDPHLSALAMNGGPTRTQRPGPSGPAVDKGNSAAINDQRGAGFSRVVNDPSIPNATGNGADMGAVELQPPQDFSVTNTNDGGAGSLRTAVTQSEAHKEGGVDRILFQPGLSGTVAVGSSTFSPLPTITQPLEVDGTGANATVSGNNDFRVLDIDTNPGDDVKLKALTLTGGDSGGAGGAVKVTDADLTIQGATLSNSTGTSGGGLHASGSNGSATVLNSTISGNAAPSGKGGGAYTYGMDLEVARSTISGNSAGVRGGGVYAGSSYGTAIRNSTISDNTSGDGAGISANYGDLAVESSTVAANTGPGIQSYLANPVLTNTIVADNSGTDIVPISFTIFSGSFTLVETGALAESVPGSNIIGVDPKLGPLASNGGPTRTHRPAHDSPVVDKGKASVAPGPDQRGSTRPFDVSFVGNSGAVGADAADIGAVELTLAEATAPVTATPQPPASTFDLGAAIKKCKKKFKKGKKRNKCIKKAKAQA